MHSFFIMIIDQQNVSISMHFLMTNVLQQQFLYCFRSSSSQLVNLINFSFLLLQTFLFINSIFLCFDTVNHRLLLKKREYYDVRGVPLIWFQSYLHNRHQCVKINQITSDSKTITFGVPQGSFLGPLVFLIYINDIFLTTPKVSFHLLAEDTCIFRSNKNYKKLEDEINTSLDNITNWLKANKLMINVKKSNVIVFKVGNSQSVDETIKIYIENQIIVPKGTARYLGVYIDKRLSWNRNRHRAY